MTWNEFQHSVGGQSDKLLVIGIKLTTGAGPRHTPKTSNDDFMRPIIHRDAHLGPAPRFAKEARVGTYILVFSIVAIPGVGPSDQPDLDIIANMTQPAAIVWLSLLSAATLACCAGMVVLKLRPNALPPVGVYAVLLTGQVTSAVVGTSAGKTFALLSGVPLALAFVVNTIVGAVNLLSVRHSVAAGAQGALPSSTESPLSHWRRLRPAAPRTLSHGAAQNVFAATACDQAIFIPLQTLATLLVNCVTGLVVWQEWSVIAVPSTCTLPSPPPTAPTLHTRPGA